MVCSPQLALLALSFSLVEGVATARAVRERNVSSEGNFTALRPSQVVEAVAAARERGKARARSAQSSENASVPAPLDHPTSGAANGTHMATMNTTDAIKKAVRKMVANATKSIMNSSTAISFNRPGFAFALAHAPASKNQSSASNFTPADVAGVDHTTKKIDEFSKVLEKFDKIVAQRNKTSHYVLPVKVQKIMDKVEDVMEKLERSAEGYVAGQQNSSDPTGVQMPKAVMKNAAAAGSTVKGPANATSMAKKQPTGSDSSTLTEDKETNALSDAWLAAAKLRGMRAKPLSSGLGAEQNPEVMSRLRGLRVARREAVKAGDHKLAEQLKEQITSLEEGKPEEVTNKKAKPTASFENKWAAFEDSLGSSAAA